MADHQIGLLKPIINRGLETKMLRMLWYISTRAYLADNLVLDPAGIDKLIYFLNERIEMGGTHRYENHSTVPL